MRTNRAIPAILILALGACDVSTGTNGSASGAEAAPAAAPTATARFVNSRENARTPTLREHYVDFSFDYPANWRITPPKTDGTERNFVRVAAPLDMGFEPYAFHVGSAYGSGDPETDRRQFEQIIPQFASQFGSNFQNYRVVSIGPARLGDYDSYGWLFTASAPDVRGGAPVQVYGRGDVVLPAGNTEGVLLISLATSRAGDINSPDQVGASGPLREIFDSFRIGAAAPAGK